MTARLFRYAPLLLLIGCSLGTEPRLDSETQLRALENVDVEFVADRSQYREGETAKFVLRNRSSERLGYNLCTSSLERRTGGAWQRSEFLRLCTAAIYTLEPGAQATHEEQLSGWQGGEYRLVTRIDVLGSEERGELFSTVFKVAD